MRKAVFTKTYTELPDYDRREILRYAGARGANGKFCVRGKLRAGRGKRKREKVRGLR